MISKALAPVHPGEILREEFLVPLGMSPYALAAGLHVPRTRVERLTREETAVTPDTALRLARVLARHSESLRHRDGAPRRRRRHRGHQAAQDCVRATKGTLDDSYTHHAFVEPRHGAWQIGSQGADHCCLVSSEGDGLALENAIRRQTDVAHVPYDPKRGQVQRTATIAGVKFVWPSAEPSVELA
jgi:addiction module HigA family antidote